MRKSSLIKKICISSRVGRGRYKNLFRTLYLNSYGFEKGTPLKEVKDMESVYAAMLLYTAGKEITEEKIEGILKAAGVTPDPLRVKSLVASLSEVDIGEAIKTPLFAAAPAAAPVEEEKEEKKEEEKEEKKEEESLQGLAALFGPP